MGWETPKTDWSGADAPTAEDFNRIEVNTAYLYELLR